MQPGVKMRKKRNDPTEHRKIKRGVSVSIPSARFAPYVVNQDGTLSGDSMHHLYLTVLMNHLPLINENPKDILSIIPEPIWFEKKEENHELCDLIILYRDKTASVVELKGNPSPHKREKAIGQIFAGMEYVKRVLGGYDFRYGLSVVYTGKRYEHERIWNAALESRLKVKP
jgi:hypothetical protein